MTICPTRTRAVKVAGGKHRREGLPRDSAIDSVRRLRVNETPKGFGDTESRSFQRMAMTQARKVTVTPRGLQRMAERVQETCQVMNPDTPRTKKPRTNRAGLFICCLSREPSEFRTQGEVPDRAGETGAVEVPCNIYSQGESKEEEPSTKAGSNEEVLFLHPAIRR